VRLDTMLRRDRWTDRRTPVDSKDRAFLRVLITSTFTFFRLHGATLSNVHSEVGYELVVGTSWSGYVLVLGTSWLGYELAWYDLVRVRVDWKPSGPI